MKLAICSETLTNCAARAPVDPFAIIPWVAQYGYDGVEFAPHGFFPSDHTVTTGDLDRLCVTHAPRLQRQAADAGIEILGLHWLFARTAGKHLTSRGTQIQAATREHLRALCRLSSALANGQPTVLVLDSPAQRNPKRGVSMHQAFEIAAANIAAIVPALDAHNVTLAIEPLGPPEATFLRDDLEAALLIQKVQQMGATTRVRLHLDVKAMLSRGDDPLVVIGRSGGTLAHFHANDFPTLLGPGQGDVEFGPIAAALRAIGYDGYISVEVFNYTDPDKTARVSIETLRRCLAQ